MMPSVLSTGDLAATSPGVNSMLERKRAVTKAVKSLGLQTDSRDRAVVLVATDSTVGNSLRDLIQLNKDCPRLKALVEEFLRGKGTGKATSCTENTHLVPYSLMGGISFLLCLDKLL